MTQVVEVNENGVLSLPPEAIGNRAPHTRYLVEAHGNTLVLRPADQAVPPTRGTDLMAQWRRLAQDVSRAWQGDQSAVETLSEMRR